MKDLISRERILEVAKELGLTVTFDNKVEDVGVLIGDTKLTFKEALSPIIQNEPKFKLNQQISTFYAGKAVPTRITKRVKTENLDTGTYEIYYDYVHDFEGGWSFSKVSESELLNIYEQALKLVMKKFNE